MSIEHLLGNFFLALIGTFCLFYGTLFILTKVCRPNGAADGDWF